MKKEREKFSTWTVNKNEIKTFSRNVKLEQSGNTHINHIISLNESVLILQ